MPLTMRPTGGHSPASLVGVRVGPRQRSAAIASASADLRWCWSIRTYVQLDHPGIRTSGRVPTLGQAKADWLRSWTAWGNAQRR